MAYTTTDLETITQAIIALSAGKRRVRVIVAGAQVEYATANLDALRALRAEISDFLAVSSASNNNFCLVTASKGY